MSFIFFFQAEDGIRDIGVTGVQTCALPIYDSDDDSSTSSESSDATVVVCFSMGGRRSRLRRPPPRRPSLPFCCSTVVVSLSVHDVSSVLSSLAEGRVVVEDPGGAGCSTGTSSIRLPC